MATTDQAYQNLLRLIRAEVNRELAQRGVRPGGIDANLLDNVIPSELLKGSVDQSAVQDGAVGTDQIEDGAVTNDKITGLIDWDKVSKYGALPEEIGAAPASHTHDASDITYDPSTSGLASTDVQGAIDELAAGGGGGGGGGPTTIFDTLLTGTQASFSVTISGTFDWLEIILDGRTTAGTAYDEICIRMNGDTGNHYHRQTAYGVGGSAAGYGAGSATEGYLGFLSGSGAASDFGGNCHVRLVNPGTSTLHKSWSGTTFRAGDNLVAVVGGAWFSTAGITTLLVFAAGGSFVAGTRLIVLGHTA